MYFLELITSDYDNQIVSYSNSSSHVERESVYLIVFAQNHVEKHEPERFRISMFSCEKSAWKIIQV